MKQNAFKPAYKFNKSKVVQIWFSNLVVKSCLCQHISIVHFPGLKKQSIEIQRLGFRVYIKQLKETLIIPGNLGW